MCSREASLNLTQERRCGHLRFPFAIARKRASGRLQLDNEVDDSPRTTDTSTTSIPQLRPCSIHREDLATAYQEALSTPRCVLDAACLRERQVRWPSEATRCIFMWRACRSASAGLTWRDLQAEHERARLRRIEEHKKAVEARRVQVFFARMDELWSGQPAVVPVVPPLAPWGVQDMLRTKPRVIPK